MANIGDVAKRAGVGVSTVSKVLNNYDNISQATREKVMQAVTELNYVPNAAASALSSKKGRRIAVVVFINNKRQAIDEINMQYLFGSFFQANIHKLDVITVFSGVFEGMSKIEIIHYLKSLSIEAVVVYGLHKQEISFNEIIQEEHFRTVVVDAPIQNEKTSYVMVDHQKAQCDIATQIIKRNETPVKDVLYLAGRRDGFVTDLRLQGVVDACDKLGVKLNAQYSNFSELMAIDLVKKYGESTDVIICASDLMAIGAVNALKDMDIFKPVCGYDGIKLLGYIGYPMLTVQQDFYTIARNAIDEAKRLIADEQSRAIILDYTITTINYEDVIM